jgi:hypothetical protein
MNSDDGRASKSSPPVERRTRRRQLHIWLSDREDEWVRGLAAARDEKVSATIRSILVAWKQSNERPS